MEIGISAEDRERLSKSLERLFADTYVLYFKTHSYHWNVTGPLFQSLHALFMEQYTELWNALDFIAERIRALGHFAPFSYQNLLKLTKIEDDAKVPKAQEMVGALVKGHEALIETIRPILSLAESAQDQVTLDLLTQRLQVHEKTAWMLRSILEEH